MLQPHTSKMLMGMMAVLLALTPWMEAASDWDHFLTTGRDFELGLFCFFAVIALAVLLARSLRLGPATLPFLAMALPGADRRPTRCWLAAGDIAGHAFPLPLRI